MIFIFTEEIYAAAVILAGGIEELLGFCRSAENELISRLRSTVTPEMCRETLITASSILAVSMLGYTKAAPEMLHPTGRGRGGQTRGSGGSSSGELRRQAELLMYPYIDDDDFSFLGVRG